MNTLPVHYVELERIYRQLEAQGYKTTALTGCHGDCGTSMLAYALSKRYQADGYKVLLVDLNLQRPNLDHSFGFHRQAWQAGTASMASICAPSAQGTHYLPAPVGNTASLSFRNQGAFSDTIQHWLQHYDRVIIDTSPLNATNYRNIPASTVCAETDATLLLIKSGFTTQSILEESCEQLQQVKANLIGCIMNDVAHPSLASELKREADRLQPWLPKLTARLKQWVNQSTLLNLRI